MKRGYCAAFFIIVIVVIGIFVSCFLSRGAPATPVDTVAIYRIAQEAGNRWPNVQEGRYTAAYPFSIFNTQEQLLYQSTASASGNIPEGIKRQDIMLPIRAQEQVVGMVLVSTTPYETLAREKKKAAQTVLIAFLLLAAVGAWFAFFLYWWIVLPFQKMKKFASQIAGGNLDIPLQMDRRHLFGAFTEAFDLMRTELFDARQKAQEADHSKKELVASLSHDIKTPVTSIRLLSELMLVTEQNPNTQQRVQTIYDKAGQIDRLITEMFQSALEDLRELSVCAGEESSETLPKLIDSADYQHMVQIQKIPQCLICVDLFRLEQVIGNILTNSYKYAGTTITVTGCIFGEFLMLRFHDHGPGVSDEELPLVAGKFYRGKNATAQREGAGLGLYISSSLMERMGGALNCQNEDGFTVELLIALV